MQTLKILCVDCDDTRARYALDPDYRVLGCDPWPGEPGFCAFRFELRAAALPAAAMAAGPVAAAAPAPLPTPMQVRSAQAIVNIFETDAVLGQYGQVTLIEGDTGRLTYGRSQTTLGSGNLGLLLHRYCGNAGARFGARIAPWLTAIDAKAESVDRDIVLHNLLRAAADDPLMREVQDQFFDEAYWQPAARAAARAGIRTPLGLAVVYDSHVHGSWAPLKREVDAAIGTPDVAGEAAWIGRYVATRRQWLASHPRADLRKTVYRMDAFGRLIELGGWGLNLPFVVRGHEVSAFTLNAPPPGCYDGPLPGTRPLDLQQPLLRGLDVRLTQLGLSVQGLDIKADGIYGRATRDLVKAWQLAHALPATGVLDAGTVVRLAA